MEQLLTLLWTKGWIFFAPFATWFALLTLTPYGKLWQNDANRKNWIGDLIQNSWKARYKRMMQRILDRIDAKLSPRELQCQKHGGTISPTNIAFSAGLINITMLLAVAYPLLSLLGQWLAGSPMQLGDLSIAPEGSGAARIFLFVWLLTLGIGYSILAISKSRHLLLFPIVIAIIFFGGVILSIRFSVPSEVTFPVSIAVAVSFFVPVTVVMTVAVATAIAGVVIVIATPAIAVAISAAIIIAAVGGLRVADFKYGPHTSFRFAYLGFLLTTVTTAILLVPDLSRTPISSPAYLLLFYAIFPIVNALADFVSTGLTRLLLRRGLNSLTWINALLDTIGRILIFLLLGCAFISYIHLIRPQDGTPMLDLAALFHQLQNDPSDFWWLAIMLGSTLLPTLLHLMIGVATVLIQYPAFLRNWTIAKLTSGGDGSDTDGWQGSAMVCAMIAASIWLPIVLFYYLLTINHDAMINGTIWLFYSYADLIGAL